jgi:DNA-binding LacI/PurR family transcriptional regulator
MDDVLAIDLDNREASRILAQHLSDLGHESVAMVSLPVDAAHSRMQLTADALSRATGFTAIERINGVREVFPHAGGVATAVSSVDEGLAAGLTLLSDPSARPTAIIAQSDLLALGVIRAAEQLGLRVPAELSVVGFDGVKLDGLAPLELTTMVQPAVEKGRAAGRAVLALLAGEHPQSASFSSTFRRGNTTATPRV